MNFAKVFKTKFLSKLLALAVLASVAGAAPIQLAMAAMGDATGNQTHIPAYIGKSATRVELLEFTVTQGSAPDTFTTMDQVKVTISGDASSVSNIRLLKDDGNGLAGVEDTQAADTATITDGIATLNLPSEYADDIASIEEGHTLTYFVAVDISGTAVDGHIVDARIDKPALGGGITFNAGLVTLPTSISITGPQQIVVDATAPVITGRQTVDTNDDGFIDRIIVTTSDTNNKLDDDFSGITGTVGDAAAAFSTGTSHDNVFYMDFADGVLASGATPAVAITANSSLSDYYTNGSYNIDLGNLLGTSSAAATDGAKPVALLSNVATKSNPNDTPDGKTKSIDIKYSENITSAPTADGFAVTNSLGQPVTIDSVSVAGDVVTLNLNQADTDNNTDVMSVAYTGANASTKVNDAAPNYADDFSATAVIDGVAPFITAQKYLDDGVNGSVDRLELTFSEPVTWNGNDLDQFVAVQNSLTGFNGSPSAITSGSGTNVLTLTMPATTKLTGVSGGTQPTFAYTQSGTPDNRVTDGTNALANILATSITDGAAPMFLPTDAVTRTIAPAPADGTTKYLYIAMTEWPTGFGYNGFTVTNSNNGVIAPQTLEVSDDGGLKIFKFTYAGGTNNDTSKWSVVFDATALGMADIGGNRILSFDKTAVNDSVAPFITGAQYLDSTLDGTVDQVELTFSEPVTYSAYEDTDWTVTANGITGLDVTDGTNSASRTLTLTASANAGITGGTAPTIAYTKAGGDVVDGSTNTLASQAAVTMSDGAVPVVLTQKYKDNGTDGSVDRLELVFSENVTWNGNDLDQIAVTAHDLTGFAGTPTVVAGSGTNTLTLTVPATANLTGVGAGTAPAYTYTQSATAGNRIAAGSGYLANIDATNIADAAAPVLIAAFAGDKGTDAKVMNEAGDVYKLIFSESLNAPTITEASHETDFVFAGGAADADNFPTSAGGSRVARTTTNVTNDTLLYTFVGGDTPNGDEITPGTDTIAVNAGSVVADSIEDTTGNDLVNTATHAALTLTDLDVEPPHIDQVDTKDLDGDGKLDAVFITFDAAVNDSSVNTVNIAFDASGYTVDASHGGLTFGGLANWNGAFHTGETPNDKYAYIAITKVGQTYDTGVSGASLPSNAAAGFINDIAGNAMENIDAVNGTDGAAPVFISAVATGDTNIRVTFSETIISVAHADGSDFSATGATITGAAINADPTTKVDLTVNSLNNTAFISSGLNILGSAVADATPNNNAAVNGQSVTDGQAPTLISAETQDIGADGLTRNGKVDHLKLTFSEPIDDSAINNYSAVANYTPTSLDVANVTGEAVDYDADAVGNNVLYIIFDEGGGANTGVTNQNITWTGASATIKDLVTPTANQAGDLAGGDITEADGAAPVIVAAATGEEDATINGIDHNIDGYLDKLVLTYSESVNVGDAIGVQFDVANTAGNVLDAEYVAGADDGDNTVTVYFTSDKAAYDTNGTPQIVFITAANAVEASVGGQDAPTQTFAGTTDGSGPAIVSAVAADVGGTDGVSAGDTVTITFSEATDGLVIDAGNIDTVLALSGAPAHTWKAVGGAIGSAAWNGDKTILTVTLSVVDGIPTVIVEDTITPATITDIELNAVAGTKVIEGSFADVTKPTLTSATLNSSTQVTLVWDENIAFKTDKDTTLPLITLKGVHPTNAVIGTNDVVLTFAAGVLGTTAITADTDDLEIAAGAFKDTSDAHNENLVIADENVIDGAGPEIISVASDRALIDGDVPDGAVFTVTFSEDATVTGANVRTADFVTTDGNWPSVATIAFAQGEANTMTVTFTVGTGSHDWSISATFNRAAGALNVANSIEDGTGNDAAASPAALVIADLEDTQKPSISSATTLDVSGNGKLDHIKVIFDERMDPARTSVAGFTADGYLLSGTDGVWTNTVVTNDTFTFALSEESSYDTGAALHIGYTNPGDPTGLQDLSGNNANDYTATAATDGAKPVFGNVVPPEYKDSNNDGQVDKIEITFSEPIAYTYEAGDFTVAGGDWAASTIDSGSVAGAVLTLNVTGPADNTALGAVTVAYDKDNGTQDIVGQGGAGDTALDIAAVNIADKAAPVIIAAANYDNDANGTNDQVYLTFSESLEANATLADHLGAVVYGGSTGAIALVTTFPAGHGQTDADSDQYITLIQNDSTGGFGNTDVSELVFSGASIADRVTPVNTFVAQTVLASADPVATVTDAAAPVALLANVATKSNPNNTPNRYTKNITIKYSEDISGSTPDKDQFIVLNTADAAVTISSASVSTDTLTLVLAQSGNNNTDQMSVAYAGPSIVDGAPNAAAAFLDTNVADGVVPVIVSTDINDTNENGYLNNLVITYSEDISTSVWTPAEWTITDGNGSDLIDSVESGAGAGAVFTITFVDDTGSTASPTFAYAAGTGITDGANVAPNSGSVTPTDDVAPAMMSAVPVTQNTINVTFSEPLKANTVAAADFFINTTTGGQPASSVAVNSNVVTLTTAQSFVWANLSTVELLAAQTVFDATGNNSLTGEKTITITGKTSGDATVTSISVTPSTASIGKGETKQFTATATYSNGTTGNVSDSATWGSSNDLIATVGVHTGLAVSVAKGSVVITATKDGKSDTATLTVTDSTLTGITITPATKTLAQGGTQQFTAIGHYLDTTTANITSQVVWDSETEAVATISATGLATAVANTGTTNITASLNGVTSAIAAVLTASDKSVSSVAITPANPTIAKGADQTFVATATYTDGTTAVVTAAWASVTPAVATIDAGTGAAHAEAKGSTTITATVGTIVVSTTLTVTDAIWTSIEIIDVDDGADSLTIHDWLMLQAWGVKSDGSRENITDRAEWISSNTSVASFETYYMAMAQTETLYAKEAGATIVTAKLDGETSNAITVTVLAASETPTITAPADITITNASTYTITGHSAPDATIHAYSNSNSNSTFADGSGNWSVSVNLSSNQDNNFTVYAVEDGKGPSLIAIVPLITQDSQSPNVSIISPTGSDTNDPTPELLYETEDGATIVVKVDGTPVATRTGESFAALVDGSHTVRVEATDAAHNMNWSSVNFRIDQSVPGLVDATYPSGVYNETITVLLTNGNGAIYYTTDGSTPTVASRLYGRRH
jgi:hypothetical protein